MAAWFLNRFLSTWRAAVDRSFPKRGTTSDGTIADRAHEATSSEHNDDRDGSVDAWDCDTNLHGSKVETGTADERRAMYAMLDEFEKQPQAQLWIYQGVIANRDIGNWKRRTYVGKNKHDKHAHLQSRPSQETKPFTGEIDHVTDAVNTTPQAGPKPGSRTLRKGMTGPDVAYLQRWHGIKDDGVFGDKTEAEIRDYQEMRRIKVDGVAGPQVWRNMGVIR